MRLFLKPIFIFVMLSIFIFGCSSKTRHLELFKEDYELIRLMYHITKVDDKEQIDFQGYNHPAQLTTEQLEVLLGEVFGESYVFFSWRKPKHVFNEEERKKLAPRLEEALNKATADQWVYFAVTADKPGLLFDSLRFTDGLCYLKDGRFNLILNNVDFEIVGNEDELVLVDPRDAPASKHFRLAVDPEQGYVRPSIVEDDPWLGDERMKWLVFDLEKLLAANPVKKDAVQADQSGDLSIGERLKKLKKLFDQELITDDEYAEKRKKILEEL
ncbi:MAG: SHOCT domain-containing protein [Proteobacteria bacterium]|nr:SHOCT domain-containing protein [Pseudomonadota bacterium]